MTSQGSHGLARILKAAGYSWQGIKATYANEAAFRQELWLAFILVPTAIGLADTIIQLALMLSSIVLVLIVEILNSAIEAVVDRFGSEQHELSGRAKDMGSAAVFLALVYLLIIWSLVLWQIFSQ